MQIKPNDIPGQFAAFAARSYDNYKAIPEKKLLKLKQDDGYKLLGQTTYNGTQVRAVVRRGNVLIEAIPLVGTTHDISEEFVAHATEELQGNSLSNKHQEQVTFAARDSIVDATEGALIGLTPEYVAARASLAKYCPFKVVTSESEMPKGLKAVEHFDDIIPLSRKVEKAASKEIPIEAEEKFGRSVLRVFGTRATRYEFSNEDLGESKKVA